MVEQQKRSIAVKHSWARMAMLKNTAILCLDRRKKIEIMWGHLQAIIVDAKCHDMMTCHDALLWSRSHDSHHGEPPKKCMNYK